MKRGILLVGASNVGKSTLVKYISTGTPIIIDAISTTQDFNIFTCKYNKKIDIIDTPGWCDELLFDVNSYFKNLSYYTSIYSQVHILYMLDNTYKYSRIDKEISIFFKKKNLTSNVTLILNKSDLISEIQLNELYSYGFGKPYDISLRNHTNLSSITDRLKDKTLDEKSPSEESKSINESILIIGRPNVGKSTIFNKLLNVERSKISSIPHTTRDPVFSTTQLKSYKTNIIDTAGIASKSHKSKDKIIYYSYLRTKRMIEDAKNLTFVVLVVDLDDGVTVQDRRILSFCESMGIGILILFNKIDICQKDELLFIQRSIIKKNLDIDWIDSIFISAHSNTDILKVKDRISTILDRRSKFIYSISNLELKFLRLEINESDIMSRMRFEIILLNLSNINNIEFTCRVNRKIVPKNIKRFIISTIRKSLELDSIGINIIFT